ncbi:uncharacterized protein LOC123704775 [Colias croceus]|uniref:uncharacterized protein LOC123704775 n=1 Tax=Colias crocea TaxID=72248 RepID=UPI001E280E6A|nr:uncharacterized protein LOC123704775 [Colias croceus]XP_045509229.1 uncharacterized protein LOC123704775 [Colias croceus]
MKRYRERIKSDPQKYEEYRKKNIERLKQKRKKISELNETEKKIRRDQWVKEKRKQRSKKQKPALPEKEESNELQEKINNAQTAKLKYFKATCFKLTIESNKKNERIKRLITMNEKLKKRNYRLKTNAEKQIKKRESIIEKMTAREQVLEDTMKKTYKACEQRSQQIILKQLITNSTVKSYVAKLIGLKGRIKNPKPKKEANPVREEIVKFYLRDDVGRCTAGKRECRTLDKEKQQIRYLLNTLQNLYEKYKKEGGNYKFTTFYRYKPFYVLAPHLGSRNTCVCVKHNNIELKFACLKKECVFEKNNLKEIIASQTCEMRCFECIHSKCTRCKEINISHGTTSEQLNKMVTWLQWEMVVHTYSKKEGSQTIQKTTKKQLKQRKKEPLTSYYKNFKETLNLLKNTILITFINKKNTSL